MGPKRIGQRWTKNSFHDIASLKCRIRFIIEWCFWPLCCCSIYFRYLSTIIYNRAVYIFKIYRDRIQFRNIYMVRLHDLDFILPKVTKCFKNSSKQRRCCITKHLIQVFAKIFESKLLKEIQIVSSHFCYCYELYHFSYRLREFRQQRQRFFLLYPMIYSQTPIHW